MKKLPGMPYCLKHQGDTSHYDPHNCTVCRLERALSFYADPKRYEGPNQPVLPKDPWEKEGLPYRVDVTRDRGEIARAALALAKTSLPKKESPVEKKKRTLEQVNRIRRYWRWSD